MDLIRESSLIQYFKQEGREEGLSAGHEQGARLAEEKVRLKLSAMCWKFDLV